MSSSPAITENRVDLVAAFTERCWARAYLYSIGELTLHKAVDKLQADAVRDGLVDELGQDRVQQIVSAPFEPYQQPDTEEHRNAVCERA